MDDWGDPISQFFQWYKTRPLLAKTYLLTCLVIGVLISFEVITFKDMYYTFEQIYVAGAYWRILSCFYYLGGIEFSFIIKAYLAYMVLYNAEAVAFGKEKLADYIMAIIFNAVILLLLSSLYDLYFLDEPLFFALLYASSKIKPFMKTQLVFNINIETKWFIWVYLGFHILMGSPVARFVAGFLSGYLYIAVKTTLAHRYFDAWPTPSILQKVVKIYLNWADSQSRQMQEEPDGYE